MSGFRSFLWCQEQPPSGHGNLINFIFPCLKINSTDFIFIQGGGVDHEAGTFDNDHLEREVWLTNVEFHSGRGQSKELLVAADKLKVVATKLGETGEMSYYFLNLTFINFILFKLFPAEDDNN